jgi:hypothetical protein
MSISISYQLIFFILNLLRNVLMETNSQLYKLLSLSTFRILLLFIVVEKRQKKIRYIFPKQDNILFRIKIK